MLRVRLETIEHVLESTYGSGKAKKEETHTQLFYLVFLSELTPGDCIRPSPVLTSGICFSCPLVILPQYISLPLGASDRTRQTCESVLHFRISKIVLTFPDTFPDRGVVADCYLCPEYIMTIYIH